MTFTYDDNTFSDLVKEVYGTRSPARKYGHLFYYYDETSEKKQMIWDDLCDRLEETMAEELEAHHRKIAMFEDSIQKYIKLGASTRRDAIRWIFDAEDISFDDPGYACHLLNIPYVYEDEFRSMR